MYRHLTLILTIASTTTLAQIPTNTSFQDFTSYLPFISINTAYIANDTRASAQLANAPANPVTTFLTLDVPFTQFIAEPLPSGVAGQIEGVNIANKPLTSDLLQYLQIDGLHPSSSFNGTQFLTTRFNDTKYENVTGGAKIEVFRNETAFYIGTGISFKSNVLIPDLTFAGGILHLLDHPAAPPLPLADTGTVLNISIISSLISQPYQNLGGSSINNAPDITVFAVQNSAAAEIETGNSTLSNYVVPGQVLYSTNLTDGFVTGGTAIFTGASSNVGFGTPLVIERDQNGGILVNGSRILQADILTSNGVVHVIER